MGAKAIDPVMARKVMIAAGVTPQTPFEKGRYPWKSICKKCKRLVTPSYINVRNGHAACKYCAKGGVTEKEALATLKESKVKPLVAYPGYKKPWKSQCLVCKKIISPRIVKVVETKKACNYCNRRTVDPKDAEAIAKKAGAKPLVPYPGARQWKCECLKCGKVIYPTLRRMRNGQNPCGWCARKRIHPTEAKEAFLAVGLKPIGKYPGVNAPWDATCLNCGERVSRKLSRIQDGRYACSYCAGRKLMDSQAKSIMVKAGVIPLEPFNGIYSNWLCKCSVCLREISPRLSNVRGGHSPCIYCSDKKFDANAAREFAISRGLVPINKYPGALAKWKVRCTKCGRVDTTTWTRLQLKAKDAGCSSCTVFGFKPLQPAYLYLITHQKKKAHKIGIGNVGARRIEKHLRNGWIIYKVRVFDKGHDAHATEQAIINWLREERMIGPAYRSGDGWTETMPSNQISLATVWSLVVKKSKGKYKPVSAKEFN